MNIRNYQIHNVLKAYQRQLRYEVLEIKQKRDFRFQVTSKPTVTNNRQNIIDKVKLKVLKEINLLEHD